MTNIEVNNFKAEKQMKLIKDLKPFVIDLKEKYGNSLELNIEYDSIMISINDLSIKKDIFEIINNLIKWATEQLNEDYTLPLNNPFEMWSLPNKSDLSLSWMLERKLKEGEPV